MGHVKIKLTGRTRFRVEKTWRGEPKLVLQVEEQTDVEETLFCSYGGADTNYKRSVKWRDARVQDLTLLTGMPGVGETPLSSETRSLLPIKDDAS